MRVTWPPAAPTIAAILVALAAPSPAAAERWLRPLPGEVTRTFDYSRAAPFTPGRHRGADFAGAPGAPVRAACGGVVVHAGPVPGGGRAVSLRCGARRVSHLPLARVVVREGAALRAGAILGTLGRGHGGLHLGVRREGDPFAYEDPLALLPSAPRPAPPPVAVPRRRPHVPLPAPAPRAVPASRAPARPSARPQSAQPPRRAPQPAPPLAWAGLALAATALAGGGALAGRRAAGRRARRSVPTPIPVRR